MKVKLKAEYDTGHFVEKGQVFEDPIERVDNYKIWGLHEPRLTIPKDHFEEVPDYPLKMQSTYSDLVVEFYGSCEGIVLVANSSYVVGYVYGAWFDHTDNQFWKPFEGELPATLESLKKEIADLKRQIWRI